MEKTDIIAPTWSTSQAAKQTQRPWTTGRLLVLAVLTIAILRFLPNSQSWLPLDTSSSTSTTDDSFDWSTLTPRSSLEYHPCYTSTQCALLSLPMDYWNSTTTAHIQLAIIRQPAAVPITHPHYGGAILLNPGGPGGSGVGFLLGSGVQIRGIVDSEDRFFDLISFDPRGVGETRPGVKCVGSKGLDFAWQVRVMEEGVFESSDAALGRLWSMAIARSGSCSLPLEDGEPDVRKYLTTASVARDMLEIVERHGEWREQEARRLLGQERGSSWFKSCRSGGTVPEELAYKPGKEKIQYWGFSYGTYLGNTFAAMFPGRIHRLIVDGVVDADNYRKTLWSDNLLDTEKDMNEFYHHCARASFPACALANVTGETTAESVSQRVANITNSLIHNPLPVVGKNPEVVTYSDVRNMIAVGLYSPVKSFPYIAKILASLEQGDGQEFAEVLQGYHDFECPATSDSTMTLKKDDQEKDVLRKMLRKPSDATMTIACTDGDEQSWLTKDAFQKYAQELAQMSPSVGSIWSTLRLSCIHYTTRPYNRFTGPWAANTSHPILLIGNTADPVTPVRFAHKMAEGFPGAVALTQDSAGHCSISSFSHCTRGHVRRYFREGTLPGQGTVCGVDEVPFGNDGEVVSEEVVRGRESQAGIERALAEAGGGFMRGAFGGRVREGWFD